jgi:probable rRNA maturation factor
MVRVDVVNAHPRYRVARARVRRYVQGVMRREHRRRATVSVVFIDGRRCRAINRKFLDHDRQTDVISFPLEEGSNLEGEIYVNLDRARLQATDYGVTFGNEVARLVIHGTLHLVGYDDRRPHEAASMRRKENAYVGRFAPGGRTRARA